jgi:hypothetical protein
MQNLPSWIPSPRSWVNAIALILFIIALQYAIAYLWVLVATVIELPPKVMFLLSVIIQLCPILLLAFIHHWLHRVLDTFFPESRLPETETVQGLFPGLMSWWEGLYGWLANHLSELIAFSIVWIFLPFPDGLNLLTLPKNEISPLLTMPIFLIVRVIFAAYLYQFEYLVHQRLIATGRE